MFPKYYKSLCVNIDLAIQSIFSISVLTYIHLKVNFKEYMLKENEK